MIKRNATQSSLANGDASKNGDHKESYVIGKHTNLRDARKQVETSWHGSHTGMVQVHVTKGSRCVASFLITAEQLAAIQSLL